MVYIGSEQEKSCLHGSEQEKYMTNAERIHELD